MAVFRSVVNGFLRYTQAKLTKVHFKTRELVLASVAAFVKTPALPQNLMVMNCFCTAVDISVLHSSVIKTRMQCLHMHCGHGL